MLSISGFHHETVDIDGEPLRITIRRFTIEQFATFQRRRDEVQRAERRVGVLLKRHAVETDGDDILNTLARLELDAPEQFAALQAERAKLDTLAFEFYRDALKAYVVVPEGQIPGTAGDCDGTCLLEAFAGRSDIEAQIMGLVYGCNTMSPRQKKALLLLLASAPSSTAPSPTPAGDAPAPTATPAGENSSANPEGVTASTEDASSGSTPA